MRLKNVAVYLTPRQPGQSRWEDGILPFGLFDAIYFDRQNSVILNPREPAR